MFLLKTDFDILPYNIPNLEGNNAFLPYVEEHEEEILISLLGKSLYDAFVAGLAEEYPEERWINLRDGGDYEYSGKTYQWVGMVKLLLPYIYSMWLRDSYDTHSGVGIVQGKAENAKVINPGKRIARAYNVFSGLAGSSCEKKDTLYGFLIQTGALGTFDDTFDDTFTSFAEYFQFNFKEPGLMNTFNI